MEMTHTNTDHPIIPIDSSRTIIAGIVVIVFFIGGFFTWASLAPLSRAVVSPGILKVDSSRKQIQHLDGGVVTEILVRDGDLVHKGDVLIKLDETRASASLTILSDGLVTALAQRARLVAERDGLSKLTFSDVLSGRRGEDKVEDILASQEAVFKARKSALQGQIHILGKQIARLNQDIEGLQSQMSAKQRQLGFAKDEMVSLKDLLSRGLTGKQRVLELQREGARLEGEIGEHLSEIAAVGTAIAEKELEIYQVKKAFQESVVNELKQVQAEVFDYQERMNAADHVFRQATVRSPVDGVVMGSGFHTIGGVVAPGATLLEIVPGNDRLIIEARIDPADIDDMRIGLPAGIKVTAFNQRNSGELAGELYYVSADVLQDSQTGQSYFTAKIKLLESELDKLIDRRLQPGMMAEVFIRVGERTPIEYLLQPLKDSFRRAWLEE